MLKLPGEKLTRKHRRVDKTGVNSSDKGNGSGSRLQLGSGNSNGTNSMRSGGWNGRIKWVWDDVEKKVIVNHDRKGKGKEVATGSENVDSRNLMVECEVCSMPYSNNATNSTGLPPT